MKLNRGWGVVAGLGATLVAGVAFGQAYPNLFITSPNGTEIVRAQSAGASQTSIYLRQARDASGYAVSTASSGTVTFATGQSELTLTNGSTISTLTIAFTASPVDGQKNCFYSKSAITTLTLSATSPQTINDGVSSNSATTRRCYQYNLANTAWNRIQ